MRTRELKRRLGQILAQEESHAADWAMVAIMSARLLADFQGSLPEPAEQYLSSVDQRRSDAVFANAQRSELLVYLRAG